MLLTCSTTEGGLIESLELENLAYYWEYLWNDSSRVTDSAYSLGRSLRRDWGPKLSFSTLP